MTEPSASRKEKWRGRIHRIRIYLKSALPFASGVLAALLALYIYNAVTPHPHLLDSQDVKNTINEVMASATPPPAFSEQVYAIIHPSLVLVQSQQPGVDGKVESSLGSGVVIDDNGDILTSLHVIANASKISLTFADGTESPGKVVSQQPQDDIAVLQAIQPPAKYYPAVLGNPNAMQVGDEAYVVGNPFGLYGSMSAGVISGFNRTFQTNESKQKLTGLIQIDTAVNPGNSGGPLLNRYGQVIGIVTGILNPTGQDVFIGIGFAVPITTAGGAVGSPPY